MRAPFSFRGIFKSASQLLHPRENRSKETTVIFALLEKTKGIPQ